MRAATCEDIVDTLGFIIAVQLSGALPEAPAANTAAVDAEAVVGQRPAEWQAYLGATAGLAGGRTPQPMPVGGAFFELWRDRAVWDMGGRVGFLFGADEFSATPCRLRARFAGSSLELCPVAISVIGLCTGLDIGAVQLSGDARLSADQTLRFSLAGRVGGQLRKEWKAWIAELSGGVWLPMTLDQLMVERADGSQRSAHTVCVSGYASVAIGYRL